MIAPTPERPLRVCYFGTYRAGYTRNQIILKGLEMQPDVRVYVCHAQLWRGIEDRVEQAGGGWRNPRFWRRVVSAYWRLWRAHSRIPEYDVMLIGYPGQFDAFPARLLAGQRRRPVVLDVLMSLHLVAEERGLTERSPSTGRLIFNLEKQGLHIPDLLIAENAAYEAYIRDKYNLPAGRFRRVPHGADDAVFHPRPLRPPDDVFRVTYHGTYLSSHGLDVVIGAAAHLRNEPGISFHLYGDGPERARVEGTARREALSNITFHGFVGLDELLDGLAQAHVCLGVFGLTRQSNFTIQNKVWEGLAMGRPVVSGDSPTTREALRHGEHIYLIPRDDPAALAAAIRELRANPTFREQLAQSGYEHYRRYNTPEALGRAMKNALLAVAPNAKQIGD